MSETTDSLPSNVKPLMMLSALAYAKKLGWSVFPLHEIKGKKGCSCRDGEKCGNPGKHPRTKKGLLDATTNEQQIREWWTRWPSANIGVACGPSGLVVVDIDPRNGGEDSLATLEQEHGALPITPTQLTGGGGQHYCFHRPKGELRLKSRPIGAGVDIKADGGYIVASPSGHMSGTAYRWDAGGHPENTAVAVLPAWIEALIIESDQDFSPSQQSPIDGFLGAAFAAAGWMGRQLGPTKAAVRCPWEDEHTSGHRYDSSTVVWAPNPGRSTGWWQCSHSHCSKRTLKDVMSALPEAAKTEARAKLGLPTAYVPPPESEPSPQQSPDEAPWLESLRCSQDGVVTRDTGNAVLMIANLPDWKGAIEHDTFADRIRWARPVPLVPGMRRPRPGEDLTDEHCTYVGHWLSRYRGITFGREAIRDAVALAARSTSVHPLQEYLTHLTWDRCPRVATWLSRYLGCPDTEYSAVTGRWWLLSAIARAMTPGCQADHMLVLEGPQGAGKTTALRILGGEWYLGDLPDLRDKDSAQVLQGRWIVEVGELDAFRGSAATRIKTYLTQRIDIFRPSYGRFPVRRPRGCVFAGTTNESEWIHDSTGARRFWPSAVGELRTDELERDRDQLWAEALVMFRSGEQWWPDRQYSALLIDKQDERRESDAWEESVLRWADARTSPFYLADLLVEALGFKLDRIDRTAQIRVGTILRKYGYKTKRPRTSLGNRTRTYCKQDNISEEMDSE